MMHRFQDRCSFIGCTVGDWMNMLHQGCGAVKQQDMAQALLLVQDERLEGRYISLDKIIDTCMAAYYAVRSW